MTVSPAPTIHLVEPSDTQGVEHVRRLMGEYAALPHTAGRWTTVARDLAKLPRPFVAPDGALLLALEGDEPLACGAIVRLAGDIGELKRVYVRPSARGRGLGETVTARLLGEAARLGLRTVRLDTAPELAAAQALYRRMGFVQIAPYRDGLLPDAICFERAVSPKA